MKVFVSIIWLVHALIHLLGFIKAYKLFPVGALKKDIPKSRGLLWLSTAVWGLIALIFYLFSLPFWWVAGLLFVLFSQALIVTSFRDAWAGTIANLLLVVPLVAGYGDFAAFSAFQKDVQEVLRKDLREKENPEVLQESDLQHLPPVVQDYLRRTGSVGKPKVHSFRLDFSAQMRNRESDWFELTTTQYNSFLQGTRLFFLAGSMKGLPVSGYHRYDDQEAFMRIKLLSLLPVVDFQGQKMRQSETVTLLNDMAVFAPATLISPEITWGQHTDSTATTHFRHKGVNVTALLQFGKDGMLNNFFSMDRYDMNEGKSFKFSTPIMQYDSINGYYLPTFGEAVWHYPEGAFSYGKFEVKFLEYNPAGFFKPE